MKLLLLLLSTSAFAQFTPLPLLPPAPDVISNKGGLLTSNGTNQIPFLPCANDEIIVWDSAEVAGFKCEAKPTGGGGTTYVTTLDTVALYVTGSMASTSMSNITLTGLTTSFTAISSNPIEVSLGASISSLILNSAFAGVYVATTVNLFLKRNGTIVDHKVYSVGADGGPMGYVTLRIPVTTLRDPLPTSGTTYTYTIDMNNNAKGQASIVNELGQNLKAVFKQHN